MQTFPDVVVSSPFATRERSLADSLILLAPNLPHLGPALHLLPLIRYLILTLCVPFMYARINGILYAGYVSICVYGRPAERSRAYTQIGCGGVFGKRETLLRQHGQY